ncbi:MAG: DNA polymerase IV [Lachnospiraceae bacterium]|nr:DNA polymerase IV [Lachnospiraceae bacterium]MDD7627781.1 DNA polymerase IV [Lachnospiraceae bacterium]MDY4117792.1 DNA polymerase IV [Lachnospiraceae bacterium]
MEHIIFHIDVNSAYLSWSALSLLEKGSKTDLRQIPAIIGGDMEKRHGVVLAKSIPAKKYGIVTGEPIVNAMRKCPFLRLEAPDHHLYAEKSRQLMQLLSDICPEIEQVSVDECYMDYTPISHLYPSPYEAAIMIKDKVRDTFGFTVNIGISDRKILAKMASDFRKPDLVHTLYSYEIKEKMWPLPVSSLFMCGKSSVEVLRKLEIETIGQLAGSDKKILEAHLKSHGTLLWEYANGIDDSPVVSTPPDSKGVGNSTTLSKDVTEREEACKTLLSLSESVAARLRKAGQLAGMVSVEIKYSNFRSVSHQTMLYSPSDTSRIIYDTACRLFDELWDHSPIRLLGVRTSKLVSATEPIQLSLFDLNAVAGNEKEPAFEKLAALDKALDDIRNKFGNDAVVRGSLLSPKGKDASHRSP